VPKTTPCIPLSLLSYQMESKWEWWALLRSRHKNDTPLMPHDLHRFSSWKPSPCVWWWVKLGPWVGHIIKIGDLLYAPHFGNVPTLGLWTTHYFFGAGIITTWPLVALGAIWKLKMSMGALRWFGNAQTSYNARVVEFWIKIWMKNSVKQNRKYRETRVLDLE
jgi:hypothetical protein